MLTTDRLTYCDVLDAVMFVFTFSNVAFFLRRTLIESMLCSLLMEPVDKLHGQAGNGPTMFTDRRR